MKLSKILMTVAAAAALVGFAGCADSVGESAKIGKDFELVNDTETAYKRGYTSLKTKHTSASALVTLSSEVTKENGEGIIGFIFGIKSPDSTDKDVRSFSVVGLRRKSNEDVQAYVSYFDRVSIDEENLNKFNNFTDKNGVKIGETDCVASEEEVLDFTKITTATKGKDIVIRVDVIAGGDDTDGDGKVEDGEGDGSYVVKISSVAEDGVTAETLLKSVTIANTVTGDTKATQYDLGIYTNVYANSTLKGKLWLTDLVNEAGIVLE